MLSSERRVRLSELACSQCDGTITRPELRELDDLLMGSPEAVDTYVWMTMLIAELSEQSVPTFDGSTDDVPSKAVELSRSASNATSQKMNSWFGIASRRPLLSATVAASLAIGLLIVTMAFMAPPFYRNWVRFDEPGNGHVPVFVAQLVSTHLATWDAGQLGTRPGANLAAGHRMKLSQGLAEIEFADGARVILQGPCEFVVDGTASGTLARGKLTARADAQAKGFIVAAPGARLVDLGTEFHVDVDDRSNVSVYVIEGRVSAQRLGRACDIVEEKILAQGEAATIRPTGEAIALLPGDATSPAQPLGELAAQMRVAKGLIARWTLDDEYVDGQAGVFRDDVGGFHGHVQPQGSWPGRLPKEESRFGHALQFGGNGSCIALPAGGDLNVGESSLTLAAWVWLEALPANIDGEFTGIFDSEEDTYILYLDRNNRQLRFKVTVPDGGIARVGIDQKHLLLRRWHHVAGVYDMVRRRAHLYLDGQLIAIEPVPLGDGATAADGAPQAAFIGENFSGRIDEIALWRRALSPGEIAYLADHCATSEN